MSTAILRSVNGEQTKVDGIAAGLMGFTWRDEPIADEQAFPAIKTALEVNPGITILNSATFYGPKTNPAANMQLIGRFFKAHPDLRSKAFVAIKGGLKLVDGIPTPSGDIETLRMSVNMMQKSLDGTKIDAFVMGRQDQSQPIETTIRNIKILADEGLFTHIAISEANASTIERANAVLPLAFHEFEYSPISLAAEELGIADACAKTNTPILAYSPTGRGLLTGSIKSRSDIPAGDVRLHYSRFNEQNFPKNLELYKHFEEIAQRKGCSPAQLSIAWVAAQKGQVIPLTGSTRADGVKENLEAAKVKLDEQDLKDMREAISKASPAGDRMAEHAGRHLMASDTPKLV